MDNFYSQFWPGLAANLAGGIALTFLFFLLKEHLFALPTVCGVWECKEIINETDYRPYKGMVVYYRIVLLQDNDKIFGTGEKDHEEVSTGSRFYEGKNRIPLDVSGKIEKRITGSDLIHLHWKEHGERRISTTLHELRVSGSKSSGNMFGKFSTTAANSHGVAGWKRVS